MADSVLAFFLQNPKGDTASGAPVGPGGSMYPEDAPAIMWGQGTPNGDLAPFNLVNKGSLWMSTDQADDVTAVYVKVDEGGDNADWVRLFVENQALIDTNDLAAAAGITNAQLANGGTIVVRSDLFDISAADSEQVIFNAKKGAATITAAYLVWQEATGASGAAEGDITIGTASGGAQVVAAAAYTVSKATGSVSALTLVSGALAADASVYASHDQAASADGTYYLFLELDYD